MKNSAPIVTNRSANVNAASSATVWLAVIALSVTTATAARQVALGVARTKDAVARRAALNPPSMMTTRL